MLLYMEHMGREEMLLPTRWKPVETVEEVNLRDEPGPCETGTKLEAAGETHGGPGWMPKGVSIHKWLVVTGTCFIFPYVYIYICIYILGIIIPIDELRFFRGFIQTTNRT